MNILRSKVLKFHFNIEISRLVVQIGTEPYSPLPGSPGLK